MRNHLKHVVGVLLAMLALTLVPLAGSAQAAGNDYPFQGDRVQRIDPWSFTTRQCVSFAAWRLAQKGDADIVRGWGNARDWDNRAAAAGIRISTTPRVGAIAQWNPNERSDTFSAGSTRATGWMRSGSYGHVAVVKAVRPGGIVLIEQYNMGGAGTYSTKLVKAPRYLYVGL